MRKSECGVRNAEVEMRKLEWGNRNAEVEMFRPWSRGHLTWRLLCSLYAMRHALGRHPQPAPLRLCTPNL